MPELLNKADVMRIINSENAVVLCCTRLRSADEVLCSIASQINSLQTIQISMSGKWREISSHKDGNGRITSYGLLDGEIKMSTPAICGCCGARMDGGDDNG